MINGITVVSQPSGTKWTKGPGSSRIIPILLKYCPSNAQYFPVEHFVIQLSKFLLTQNSHC